MWKSFNPDRSKVSPGNSLRRAGGTNSRVGPERRISRSLLGSFRMMSLKKAQSAWIQSHDEITNFTLTWWGSFTDGLLREKFQVFLRRDFNGTLLCAMLFLFAFFFQPAMLAHFISISQRVHGQELGEYIRKSWLAILSTVSVFVILLVPGCVVLYLRLWKNRLTASALYVRPPMMYSRLFPHLSHIETFFFFGALITLELMLFARLYGGQCEFPSDIANPIFCNKESQVHSLPQDSVFAVILLPGFLSHAVKGGLSWKLTIAHWMLSFCFLLAAMSYAGAWNSKILLLFSAFEGIRMLTLHRQNINLYMSAMEHSKITMEKMEAENKRVHAEEMRNFIANTAHDLKSPMQAFANSITTLRETINDALQVAVKGDAPGSKSSYGEASRRTTPRCSVQLSQKFSKSSLHDFSSLEKLLLPCLQVLDDLTVTCEFMSMSINRALDYSKVSRGIALLPSYQCTNIIESLEYTVKCIRSLQENIEIVVHPLPEDLFTFVITDRQWLNENLLCVLSNAIKFSYIGPVEIKVELIDEKPPIARSRASSGKASAILLSSEAPAVSSGNSAAPKQRMLKFTILDRGIGITPDAALAAFRPMEARRNKTDRHSGGAGLGLYSLAKRVEALGGKCGIKKRSDGHEGTVCWFTEPYRPDYSSPASEHEGIDNDDDDDEDRQLENSAQEGAGHGIVELQRSSYAAVETGAELFPRMPSFQHDPVYSPQAGMTTSGSRSLLARFRRGTGNNSPMASRSHSHRRRIDNNMHVFDAVQVVDPISNNISGRSSRAHSSSGNLTNELERGRSREAFFSNALTALEPSTAADPDDVNSNNSTGDPSNRNNAGAGRAGLESQQHHNSLSTNASRGRGVTILDESASAKTPTLSPIFEGKESPRADTRLRDDEKAVGGGGASGAKDSHAFAKVDKTSSGYGTAMLGRPKSLVALPPHTSDTTATALGRPKSLATLTSAADVGLQAGLAALNEEHGSTAPPSGSTTAAITPGYLMRKESSGTYSSGGPAHSTSGKGFHKKDSSVDLSSSSRGGSDRRLSSRMSRMTSAKEPLSLSSLRILVVDDSLPILKSISRTLEKAKHVVETAQNGAIALEMMKERQYDVVLMDIQMPVMDGIEAVESFRKFESGSCLNLEELGAKEEAKQSASRDTPLIAPDDTGTISPSAPMIKSQASNTTERGSRRRLVIGVSANSDAETAAKAIQAGMDRFMPKPFTMKQFQEVVLQEMPHLAKPATASVSASQMSTPADSLPASKSPTITAKKSHSPSFTAALGKALAAVQTESGQASPAVLINEVRNNMAAAAVQHKEHADSPATAVAQQKARVDSPALAAASKSRAESPAMATASRQSLNGSPIDEAMPSGCFTPISAGKGSVDGFETPSHKSSPAARKFSSKGSSRGGEISIVSLNILAVDDSLPILRTIARTLEKAKHTVETAQNGLIALNMMKEKQYDVVLMDIQMPVMDGIESVEKLREYEKLLNASKKFASNAKKESNSLIASEKSVDTRSDMGSIPEEEKEEEDEKDGEEKKAEEETNTERHQLVIGVSANSDAVTASKALKAGMDKFMPKPFTTKQFNDMIIQLRPELVKNVVHRHSTPPREKIDHTDDPIEFMTATPPAARRSPPSSTATPAATPAVVVGIPTVTSSDALASSPSRSGSVGSSQSRHGSPIGPPSDATRLLAAADVLNQPTPVGSPGLAVKSQRSSVQDGLAGEVELQRPRARREHQGGGL